jgi:WD40 repeat protein
LSGGPETVESVAFSPDGGLVAAGDVSHVGGYFGGVIGTIAVWDVRSGRRVWTWTSTEGAVDALAFSPDGGTLAAALEDGAVHLFDWQTNRVRWTVDPVGNGQLGFETLAYSPKGILATGSHAGVVQLWDPRTHTEIGHLIQAANAPVAAIAFNPTGDEFATTEGGSLGVTRIWASSTQQQFGGDLPGELGRWENVRYTPDGAELLTLGSDGRGSAWPTTLEQWQMHACAVAARNLTHEEWSQYITGRGYRKTCPEFPTGS